MRSWWRGSSPAEGEGAPPEPVAVPPPPEPALEPAEEERRGWFSRLRAGLSKSSTALTDGINAIFTRRRLDQAALDDFYTAQRSAFARDGHATVVAFERARSVVASAPGPGNVKVTDTFSLKGITAAYTAITTACPAK